MLRASPRARLLALLVPRVRAGWPAIGAIALAVVLAHSGVRHLDAGPALAEHYRTVVGGDWTRMVGIVQLVAAGGLCFRRTRAMTAAAFAAIVLLTIGNQLLTGRASAATLTSLLLFGWAVVVAWGEARRAVRPAEP